MKEIGIATDSNCGISPSEAEKLQIMIVPMPICIGDKCYYENLSISRKEFFEYLNSGEKVFSSQPDPQSVVEVWREGLKKYKEILYIPMSSGLSGSCNTAQMLAMEEEFENRVFVVDNGRSATLLHRSILDALEMIEEGYTAKEIKEMLENAKADMVIYLGVETLEHLKKGGRISPTTAAIGTLLNVKPILKFDVGILETYKKCRGMKRARKEMLEAVKKDMETFFQEQYKKDEIYLVAASSADKETTDNWIMEIQGFFPGQEVLCDELSLSFSCHTGEGALGIGCSCRPKRKNDFNKTET